ncbi:hypothetical protein DICPUDRAFT_32523 [Dictyostelium purpureum]|uniref:Mitochondrial substrate carrier family protein n=1 Tax=Dictyostelium purpureum TaxID=5786 RepID=F0ZJ94_DICPU|nr:uncharacterized protein DICPUDRAFT_32523 [Dictyostelium purpureum]EGC35979.1 hypothetical protein DICPUDRAFT_32523 [Dictyostelium purpureum]|eukprot:XP_003287480.1 hypothetical protein DICPUDRAFT_32523 [Dictyostelium purpureum]
MEEEGLSFEQFDRNVEKPNNSKELDSVILKQTLNTINSDAGIKPIPIKNEELSEKDKESLKERLFKNDDISDDEDEYIKNKKKEIENIKPHYSSEDEMIKFSIQDLKTFIEKLEQSNLELALEFQNDPDPVYYESINENIQVIEKKKRVLKDLEDILVKKEESVGHRFLFGGSSCMVAACVTNPIDVLKTRLQIHGELNKMNTGGSGSFIGSTINVIRSEGIAGLYKGLTPSLLREGSYSTIRMGGYDIIKGYFIDQNGKTNLLSKILSGGISGAIGASIANPSDLIKVRMQASSKGIKYKSIGEAFRQIITKEGWGGLYKGVWPTTQRAALLTASQIPSYDHVKHLLLDHGIIKEEGLRAHVISSIFAGLVASITTSPVDLVKTRIMNQPVDANGKGLLYSSSFDCFKKTYRAEGFFGLYKGFLPNWFRIGPHTIVTFIAYEYLRKIGGISPV